MQLKPAQTIKTPVKQNSPMPNRGEALTRPRLRTADPLINPSMRKPPRRHPGVDGESQKSELPKSKIPRPAQPRPTRPAPKAHAPPHPNYISIASQTSSRSSRRLAFVGDTCPSMDSRSTLMIEPIASARSDSVDE